MIDVRFGDFGNPQNGPADGAITQGGIVACWKSAALRRAKLAAVETVQLPAQGDDLRRLFAASHMLSPEDPDQTLSQSSAR
ncbi:MAG: hypothetical protein U0872_04765 [Planctomycetaceae bacterium]